jgi:anaerobic dimethyl sulfoxide reductase subunit B (iron-sulfur subunit)
MADGTVIHHADRCIGCQYCEMACPFGAPRFDTARGVMTKCDFCQHGEARQGPSCVAACPTEALRALPQAPQEGAGAMVPGFVDPSGCSPNLRFIAPRGRRRAALYEHLRAMLRREDGDQ